MHSADGDLDPGLSKARPVSSSRPRPEIARRSVYWPEIHRREPTPVYRQENLGVGATLEGPAIIELPTTTVAVRPGQTLVVDDMLNYVIAQPDFQGGSDD